MGVRWGSPSGIALIGVVGSIAAALIAGIFTLVVARQGAAPAPTATPVPIPTATMPVPTATPVPVFVEAESKFLGEGFATVEGPESGRKSDE